MINKHVEDYLDYYCSLPHSPDYAVLIKGAWGCGKTWFINKYKDKLEFDKKRHLYVSLYGIGSLSEVEDAFFQQLHPILSSKGMAITGKILKGVLRTTLKIDLDGDNKPDASVSSQVPELNLPEYLKNTADCIMIFDDLERCNLPIESILGFINHFVEHQGIKVIILANEDEILKRSKGKETEVAYQLIKEKLIGKTLGIVADVDDAINDFIQKVNNTQAKATLIKHKSIISSLYAISEYENLRNLKQAIWDFERIYCALPEKAFEIEELIQQILAFTLAFSFEIRKGSMLPTDIMKLRALFYSNIYPGKKGEAPNNPLLEIINKYSTLGIQEPLPSEAFWLGMFDKGIIDKEEIQASLLKSTYFKDEKTPEWVTLWHFFDLTDDEFEKTFKAVIEEYKNITYDDIGVIKHVTGMFLWLSDIGIYDKDKSQIISEFKQYIDSLKSNKALNQTEQLRETVFELDSYGGLGFFGNNLPEFKEMCEYINKSLDSVKIESMPNAGSDLLIMMQSDFQKFSKMIRHSNSEDQIFYDTPIFKYIDPMEFVRTYLSLLPKFRRKIAAIFIKRYEIDSIAERLIDERDWLKSVRDILSEEATARKGTVSGYVTSSFVDSCLNKIITNLEEKAANQEAGAVEPHSS